MGSVRNAVRVRVRVRVGVGVRVRVCVCVRARACVCFFSFSPSFGMSRSNPKSFKQPLPKDCHRQRTLLSPFHGSVTENSVL
jgi:hypothetical protein